jgi:hypothetical protein
MMGQIQRSVGVASAADRAPNKHTIHQQGGGYYAATIHANGIRIRGFGKDPKEAVSRSRQLSKRY